MRRSRRNRAKPFKCRGCGADSIGFYNRANYCGHSCYVRHSVEQRNRVRQSHSIGVAYGYWLNSWRKCVECGGSFSSPRKGVAICSAECRRGRGIRQAIESRSYVVDSGNVECQRCGDCFHASSHRGSRSLCDDCKQDIRKEQKKHKRRCRRYGTAYESINRKAIFDRDKWRCHSCGYQCLPTWSYLDAARTTPHPCNATLDHVTPISRGGRHMRDNVACACFHCNSLKGNR